MGDSEKLGKNIAGLRRFYGETQAQLAEYLSVGKSTVGEYERSRNIPDKEMLQDIASHYQVPIDMLINYDLSDMGKSTFEIKGIKHALELMEILFPLVSSPEALENESFRKGHQICQEMWKNITEKNIAPLQARIDDCIDMLFDALFSDVDASDDKVIIKIPEAAANLFWLKMIFGYLGITDKMILQDYNSILYPRSGQSFIKRAVEIKDKERGLSRLRQRRRQFIEEEYSEMSTLLRVLKHAPQWSDLGDFWLAVMYLYSIVADEEASPETNEYISIQLLTQFAIAGNPYAIRLWRFRLGSEFDGGEWDISFV